MPKKKKPKARPASTLYAADRTFGILLSAFSLFGMCWGGVAAALGSALGAGKGAPGGIGSWNMMVCGILSSITSVVLIFAGILVMGSSRRGFLLAVICSGIDILLGVLSLPYGALQILSGLIICYFCYIRISGKQGPKLDA